jgi:diacylglycerol kinase (ATP)
MTQKLLIWNAGAGKSDVADQLQTLLDDAATDFFELTRQANLRLAMEEAIAAGCETVIAAGGDGTVNVVVNALMEMDAERRPVLAILPLGTANDFAGTLCIPDNLHEAIALVGSGACLPIDVVRIKAKDLERHFANVAAGGNSVRVSEELTDELKSRWGAYCYLRGAINVLTDLQSFRVTAQCDQEQFEQLDCWAVLVANGKTNAGRITVAPSASPIDGLLDVVIIRDGSVLDILEIASAGILGNFLECEQVVHRQVKRLRLKSQPGMRFTMDGEIIDEEPVQFDVVPGAIRMFVGPGFLQSFKPN